MAVQQVFKRFEKKYLLTKEQEAAFLEKIAGKMIMDQYGEHTICNIYFDTEHFDLIRVSLDHPIYKEKLRLRTYGVPENGDHQAFVEIKKKYDGVVYKRRIAMPLKTAEDYLYRGIRPQVKKKDEQILNELDWFLKLHPSKPKVCLTYVRRAFYGAENSDFRMTLDKDITCRNYDVSLMKGVYGERILEPDTYLLEIKIPGVMPLWMSRILAELKIYPVSISKYGSYYKNNPELYKTAAESARASVNTD